MPKIQTISHCISLVEVYDNRKSKESHCLPCYVKMYLYDITLIPFGCENEKLLNVMFDFAYLILIIAIWYHINK